MEKRGRTLTLAPLLSFFLFLFLTQKKTSGDELLIIRLPKKKKHRRARSAQPKISTPHNVYSSTLAPTIIKFPCSTSSFFFLSLFFKIKKTSKDDPLIKRKDHERTRSTQSKISIPHNVYFDLGPAYKVPSLDLSSFFLSFLREKKNKQRSPTEKHERTRSAQSTSTVAPHISLSPSVTSMPSGVAETS